MSLNKQSDDLSVWNQGQSLAFFERLIWFDYLKRATMNFYI